jgi:hypothetical protein
MNVAGPSAGFPSLSSYYHAARSMNFARLLSSSSSFWRAQDWVVLAVLIGFLEVSERW